MCTIFHCSRTKISDLFVLGKPRFLCDGVAHKTHHFTHQQRQGQLSSQLHLCVATGHKKKTLGGNGIKCANEMHMSPPGTINIQADAVRVRGTLAAPIYLRPQ